MSSPFSASDAALSLFPLIKRDGRFVGQFCLLFGVVSLVTSVVAVVTGMFEGMTAFMAGQEAASDDPEAMAALLAKFPWGAFAVLFVVQIVLTTILSASALRKTVFSEERGLFGLAFGPDEIRLLQAQAIMIGLFVAVGLIGSLVAGLISAVATLVLPGLAILGPVLLVCVFLGVAVRFALWGVVTTAEQRVSMNSWAAQTKGAFWTLMGAYLLWGVVALVITLVGSSVFTMMAMAMGGSLTEPPTTLGALLAPGTLIAQFLTGALNGFVFLGSICVGAFAWHQMQSAPAVEAPGA